jgi:hypothetical protein
MIENSLIGYVYHKQLVSSQDIKTLIEKLPKSQSYYFLRYSHAVSGICMEFPAERGEIEGQMFNAICELRWKKYKSGYEVILLSKEKFELKHEFDGFKTLDDNEREIQWEICDHKAYWQELDGAKYPKPFIFKGENNQTIKAEKIHIKQRYFKDSATATVHFVALTI